MQGASIGGELQHGTGKNGGENQTMPETWQHRNQTRNENNYATFGKC